MAEQAGSIKVKIGQLTYQITANEDPTYIREIAHRADEMIMRVLKSNPNLNVPAATVLALVNAVDSLDRSEAERDRAISECERAQRIADEHNAEKQILREQCWEIKKDLLYYRNLCELYEERLTEVPRKTAKRERTTKPKADGTLPLDLMQRSFVDEAGKVQSDEESDSI